MKDEIVTNDLSQFGYRELSMAGELLTALKTGHDKTRFLGDRVSVFMNRNSGYVFLSDEDFNTAMMNGNDLEDFFSCPICGHEGFLDEMEHNPDDSECQEYLKQIRE